VLLLAIAAAEVSCHVRSSDSRLRVQGTERIAWTQVAPDPDEFSHYRYVAYVDGISHPLFDVRCEPGAVPTERACAAPLPIMVIGPHRIELATVFVTANRSVESMRSAGIDVRVIAGAAGR
jgi:hypothetical protein